MSAEIPPEIWLSIAEFIPDHDIYRNLRTINSSFFHLAMDIRYRQVRMGWDPKFHVLPRIMTRLSDPFVARKIKHLIVDFICDPKFIRSSLAKTIKKEGQMIAGITAWVSNSKYSPFKERNTRALKAIIRLVKKLQNTVTFEINTNFNDGLSDVWTPPTFLRNLASVWSSFGANLQSLSIRTELLVLQEISAINPYFQSLTSLQISTVPLSYFGPDRLGRKPDLNALAPFINNLSPKLKRLSLIFTGLHDLPDFFCHLSLSLALEQLKIRILVYARSEGDDPRVESFLCGGAHIFRELDLIIRTTQQDELVSSTSSRLFMACAADERCFSHLRSLKINPTGPDRTEILYKAIQRASGTLQDLVIYDVELSQEEALIVINALSECSHLVYLRLQINKLDITIMDSMAKNLPGLKRLDIWWNVTGQFPRDGQLRANLEKQCYTEWKLEDISLYIGHSAGPDIASMRALALSVPAIKTFCGRGQLEEIEVGGWSDRLNNN